MSDQYLLPCGCGQKVRVGPAQAGQAVACGCGKTITVPTLRGLRALERAPAADADRPRGPAWSPWHGAAFSGGLAVAAVSLLLFGINLWYLAGANFYSEDRSGEIIGAATVELDNFSADMLLDEWNSTLKEGLSHVHTPDWILAQESAKVYRWRTIAFACLGTVALVVAVGALFFGRRR